MASKHQNGDWSVRKSPRRVRSLIEIRNGRGTVAVVYTNERDARYMAASKRMARIIKAFLRAGQSKAARADAIAQAEALLAELEA